MTAKCRRLLAQTKARIALAAICGHETLSELAAMHRVHPVQISNWKMQLLVGDPGLDPQQLLAGDPGRDPQQPYGMVPVGMGKNLCFKSGL